MSAPTRAVVIVSGGAAISPFTTPRHGCGRGLSAGSTDTGLREALLAAGYPVYTSPANVGSRPVTNDPEFGGFDDPPEQLPAELTVNAVGPIDDAGEHLAAFLAFLAEREEVSEIDLVAHSMGGLFSRAAIRSLHGAGHPVRIRSLTTLGTPWEGSFAADFANGHEPLSTAAGDADTEAIMVEFKALVELASTGAGQQVTRRYLAGPGGWNERQGDALAGIPVTLVAGDHFRHPAGSPAVYPHDGLVQVASALAVGVPRTVLGPHASHLFPDVHSIYCADQFGLPWHRALTWDPEVVDVVITAIENGATE